MSAEPLVKLWEVRAVTSDRLLKDLYTGNAGMLVTSEETVSRNMTRKLATTLETSKHCCEEGAVDIITYFTPKLLAKRCDDRPTAMG